MRTAATRVELAAARKELPGRVAVVMTMGAPYVVWARCTHERLGSDAVLLTVAGRA